MLEHGRLPFQFTVGMASLEILRIPVEIKV